jgi:hypothetical protein
MAGQRRCALSLPNFSGPNAIDRMRSVHQEGKAGATAAQRNRFNPAPRKAGRWTGIEAIHPAQDASIGVHRRAQESSLIAPTRKASQGRRQTGNRSDSSDAGRQGRQALGHRPHTGHEFEPSPGEAGPRVTTHASVRPLPWEAKPGKRGRSPREKITPFPFKGKGAGG